MNANRIDTIARSTVAWAIVPAVIVCLPALTFFAFKTRLVQDTAIDPWIYVAYINEFGKTTARFGMTYYGNRIAFILVAKLFGWTFGAVNGYLAFAYSLLVAAAAAGFAIGNRFYSRGSGLVASCWICLTPWLPRSLFHTYVDGITTVYLLIAVALLIVPQRRQLLFSGLAGAALALAVNCNFLMLAIGPTFIPGWIYLNRAKGAVWIGRAALAVLAGFIVQYLALGMLMQIASGGSLPFFFDIKAMQTSVSLLGGGSASWFVPLEKLISDPDHYYLLVPPFFLCAITAVVLKSFRRSLWSGTQRLRLQSQLPLFAAAHLALAILLALILHVFFAVAWLAEYYYVIYFLPGCVLVLICLVGEADQIGPHPIIRLVPLTTFFISIGIALLLPEFTKIDLEIPRIQIGVWCFLAGITIVIILLSGQSLFFNTLGVVLLIFSSVVFYAASQYSALVLPSAKIREALWDQYRASLFLLRYVNSNVPSGTSVRFWYRSRSPATTYLDGVQSTFLWQFTRVARFDSNDPGMPTVNPTFYKEISGVGSLVLLGEDVAELEQGEQALFAARVPFKEVSRSQYVGKRFSLYVALLSPKMSSRGRAISLDTAVRAGSPTRLEENGDALTFSSAAVPWSYIAQMPLLAGCIKSGGWVTVDVQVRRGTIGVGIFNRKTNTFSASGSVGSAEGEQTISLWVDFFSSADDLILRNWDRGVSAEGVLKAAKLDVRSGATPPACDPDPARTKAFAQARSLPLKAMLPGSAGVRLRPGESGVAFTSASQPWSYIGRMPLPVSCIRTGGWIAADIRVTRGTIGVGVLNRKGNEFLISGAPSVSKKSQTIYLRVNSLSDAGDLVIRNWAKSESSEGILESVRVASENSATAQCRPQRALDNGPPGNAVKVAGVFAPPFLPGSMTRLQDAPQIETPPQPWGYAAQFPLLKHDLKGPLWVRVRTDVRGAAVGIGILNVDGTKFLVRDMVSPGDSMVTLPVSRPASMGDLVIQSWAQGAPAEVKVESVLVMAAPP